MKTRQARVAFAQAAYEHSQSKKEAEDHLNNSDWTLYFHKPSVLFRGGEIPLKKAVKNKAWAHRCKESHGELDEVTLKVRECKEFSSRFERRTNDESIYLFIYLFSLKKVS